MLQFKTKQKTKHEIWRVYKKKKKSQVILKNSELARNELVDSLESEALNHNKAVMLAVYL